jgi:hypothetical protein
MHMLISEPVKGTEATALRRLYQTVKDLDGLLLVNFYLGPRQFDFVLALPEYTALIELKSLSGPAFGGQNGNWSIRGLTGEKKEYPGLNPWSQAVAQANVLSDEMSRFQKTHQNVRLRSMGSFIASSKQSPASTRRCTLIPRSTSLTSKQTLSDLTI